VSAAGAGVVAGLVVAMFMTSLIYGTFYLTVHWWFLLSFLVKFGKPELARRRVVVRRRPPRASLSPLPRPSELEHPTPLVTRDETGPPASP